MQNHNLICNSVLIQGLPRQAWIRLAKSRNQLENPFPQLVVSSRPWLFLKLKFLIQTTPWGECMHNDNTCKTLEHPHRAFLLQFSLRWPFSSVPTISFPLSISDITRILPLRFLFFFFSPHSNPGYLTNHTIVSLSTLSLGSARVPESLVWSRIFEGLHVIIDQRVSNGIFMNFIYTGCFMQWFLSCGSEVE